ncbi:MAG: class I SAM-dependent methyltransferase [Pseudomonadota bacterium]
MGRKPWHFLCRACGYEGSTLASNINEASASGAIDEAEREAGLKAVRQENFREIVARIAALVDKADARLLDVGCAHGWFLEEAGRVFQAQGIEPDDVVRRATAAKGLQVRGGYFPSALREDEKFDVIIFNDVIEHIPDIAAAVDACLATLVPGGVLVLNLPNSGGFFYRLSGLFSRFGWAGPFARLWQLGLPSPHVHYFNQKNLRRLVEQRGFDFLACHALPSVHAKGLWDRLRFVKGSSRFNLCLQYVGILCLIPMLRILPSDIIVCMFRKPG